MLIYRAHAEEEEEKEEEEGGEEEAAEEEEEEEEPEDVSWNYLQHVDRSPALLLHFAAPDI